MVELEVEGRRPVVRSKKTWIKVMEEDTKKLNITEDMAENTVKAIHITGNPRSRKLGILNKDNDDDDKISRKELKSYFFFCLYLIFPCNLEVD